MIIYLLIKQKPLIAYDQTELNKFKKFRAE